MALTVDLTDKQALVCGASEGIGRATAQALAEAGASVTVLARSAEKLSVLQQELQQLGAGTMRVIAADMQDVDGTAAKVTEALHDAGTFHILINNTGGPPPGPILKATPADFLAALTRHLFVAHRLVQLLLPGMIEASYGRIVNVISSSVYEPIPNLGVSNTTRAAMAGWSKSVSRELPATITINNILPGYIATGRLAALRDTLSATQGIPAEEIEAQWLAEIPEGRLGAPEELGTVIAFLASTAGAYIRGQSLAIDGGRLRSI